MTCTAQRAVCSSGRYAWRRTAILNKCARSVRLASDRDFNVAVYFMANGGCHDVARGLTFGTDRLLQAVGTPGVRPRF